jgi:alpha-beta hydrolase superfamily lysophospholipase
MARYRPGFDIEWERWMAATRLAVREARLQAGADRPIHLVGFSNGGALAMKYALDSLEDPRLERPARIILISPMIGVTRYARFAGLAALPALLPPFERLRGSGSCPSSIHSSTTRFRQWGAAIPSADRRVARPDCARRARSAGWKACLPC